MKVITEGHEYILEPFEGTGEGQRLAFIRKAPKVGGAEGELVTVMNGTTNEEVLEVLIDRMQYLQNKAPCRENAIVITKLEESLMWLHKRTGDRIARGVEGTNLK